MQPLNHDYPVKEARHKRPHIAWLSIHMKSPEKAYLQT